jgi:hypothetical protein
VFIRNTFRNRTNRLAYFCIAILLLATLAQATHVCAFQVSEVGDTTQLTAAFANNSICLTCLMAQWATLVLIAISFFLVLRPQARSWFPQAQPQTFLQFFQLYVRPPPAF